MARIIVFLNLSAILHTEDDRVYRQLTAFSGVAAATLGQPCIHVMSVLICHIHARASTAESTSLHGMIHFAGCRQLGTGRPHTHRCPEGQPVCRS